MTDFGRRAGEGDMLKSVYDDDDDGVIAIAQTEADMEKADYDPTLAAIAALLTDHDTQHEDGGTDEIDCTGLEGAGGAGVLGDGTAGRVLRFIRLQIDNGSNDATIKCHTGSMWNGDVIALQDNIAKSATTGHFKLDSTGGQLTLLNTGLTGSVLVGLAILYYNASAIPVIVSAIKLAIGLQINFIGLSDGVNTDLTVMVDTGLVIPHILYITDA